ncbi:MAG: YHS domain-containing protein [Candidatus Bipolaricaulaceae bacterium]
MSRGELQPPFGVEVAFPPGACTIHLKGGFDARESQSIRCVGWKWTPNTAPAKLEYKGRTFYFCAPGCKALFEKNPEKYLKK